MLVYHAHWKPPQSLEDRGGMFIWGETSAAPDPVWRRGRLPKALKPQNHPFCVPETEIHRLVERACSRSEIWEGEQVILLPTTRSGPLPSPGLIHSWEIDQATRSFLAPWKVQGIWLPPASGVRLLVSLLSRNDELDADQPHFVVGDDARFWGMAALLVLEVLAAQKMVPLLVPKDAGDQIFHARWLPVLDGKNDAPRIAQLESAMPPVCRAGYQDQIISPRYLLSSFLNVSCDALARCWGKGVNLPGGTRRKEPAFYWLEALFCDDPEVQAAPAQLKALSTSHRAWLRSLQVAGDGDFRIAFQLQAPIQQENWQLRFLLQARDDPSLLIPSEEIWKTRGELLSHLNRHMEQPQEKLLGGLGYAARLFPPLSKSLKNKHPTEITIDSSQAYTFLRQAAPLLEEAGFGLLVPPWWNQRGARLGMRLRLKPAKSQTAEQSAKGVMSYENLVNYQWELSLGDTTLTEEEFYALAELKSPLVQIRGQWVQLDPDQIEAAIQFWDKQRSAGEMGLLEALRYELGVQESQAKLPIDEVIVDGWLADWLKRFSNQSEQMEEIPQPCGLNGVLRPYQRLGYSWLHFFNRSQLGACLADDMGLGKTIQTLALLLKEKEDLGTLPGPVLLICPTSVVANWKQEVQRFAPSLQILVHQGGDRMRGEALVQAAQEVDVVLTSYALVRQDAKTLQSIGWLGVVLDEAQNIKNPNTMQTQAVFRLPAGFRLALTGTPVENRLMELWSIMQFLNPGYLGSRKDFRARFALPIERHNDPEAVQRLKQLVGPFILRRVKTDPRVIDDLPEKLEMKVYSHLTEEQATLYQAVVQDAMQVVENSEGIQRRGQVLSMLMQLKQICNHPVQYLHQGGQGDDIHLVERSGKLERLVEMLEEILAEGDRVLIFTQFAEMGSLLSECLPGVLGAPAQFLHGGVPAKAREKMVKRFQESEAAPPIFILSLKAGGTGLNLTRANHVFHFDRWWNPAVEDQATDRAFRIGQKRNVLVHKFVTLGTLEEKLDELIESKKGLAQMVVGSGEQWLTELSTEDLRGLVQLRQA